MNQITSSGTWREQGVGLFRQRLLRRPVAKPGEHYLGYWLRTAHENGLPHPAWLQPAKAQSGLPKGVGRARWCPACLAQPDSFWQEAWQAGSVACMTHQCWLEDTCPACKRITRWKSVRFASCKCGYLFASAPPARFSQAVAEVLCPPSSSEEGWRALTVEDRWRLARFLGLLHHYGLHGKPLKKASGTSVAVERDAVTAGAALLKDGREALHDLFQRLRAPGTPGSTQLLREAFPRLLVKMKHHLPEAAKRYLLAEIDAYLPATVDTTHPVVWHQPSSKHLYSAKDCAALLQIRPERVSPLLFQHQIKPSVRTTRTGRSMLMVSPSQLKEAKASLQDLLSLHEAARCYGFSAVRQQELIKAGLIQARGSKVVKSSLEKLLGRLASPATEESILLKGSLPLSQAFRKYLPAPLTTGFVQAMLDGQIHGVRTTMKAHSIRTILVSRQSAIDFNASHKAVVQDVLSIPQAADMLGLKQEVLYHLVNQGHIAVVTKRLGRRGARCITAQELERFSQAMEPLSQAARHEGIGSRGAVQWAQAQGLSIVSGPGIDGGRQYFIQKHSPDKERGSHE